LRGSQDKLSRKKGLRICIEIELLGRLAQPELQQGPGVRSTTRWHEAISTASTIDRLAIIKRIAEAHRGPLDRSIVGALEDQTVDRPRRHQ
jgi:hypothetical protein